MKFIDICAGIGGFRLGLERAGHECIGFVEKDKFAVKSYRAMYNTEGEWYAEDITKIKSEDIPASDCWCFGFPCQDISVAGKQKGLTGERSGIFYDIISLLKGKSPEDRPNYIIVENVKNLLSIDGGGGFTEVLSEISEAGYDAEWQVLNSKDFGVPQNRERVFIVGHLRGGSAGKVFPIEGTDGTNSCSLDLFGCVDDRNSQRNRVYSGDGLAPTVSTCQGGNTEPKVALPTFCDLSKGTGVTLTGTARCLTARYNCGVSNRKGENSDVAIPVITPDRAEKRQNGRRFKEDGEPMFTLTSQDRHGVAVELEPIGGLYTGVSKDFNSGIYKDCCRSLKANSHDSTVALKVSTHESTNIEPLGDLRNVRTEYGKHIRKDYESGKLKVSRHDFIESEVREDGVANTLSTVPKDNQLAVKVAEATKKGFAECIVGEDSVNLAVPGSKTRRGRVGRGVANTLDTSCNQGIFVKVSEDLTVYAIWYEKYQCYVAIRKLTPKECFRLQGFHDELFEKAQEVNSDSQLYKQAGNAVTVNVAYEIGKRLGE